MKVLFFVLLVTSVQASADSANYLRIKTTTDLTSSTCEELTKAKTFKVDINNIQNLNCLEFYLFTSTDRYEEMCFVGRPEATLEVIDYILEITTGDAWVTPGAKKITSSTVKREFVYEGEGGESSEVALVKKCK